MRVVCFCVWVGLLVMVVNVLVLYILESVESVVLVLVSIGFRVVCLLWMCLSFCGVFCLSLCSVLKVFVLVLSMLLILLVIWMMWMF